MKLVHCADVHIGMEFAANRMKSRQRREEILLGFLKVVKYCGEQRTDVLLIAGDLFDNEEIGEEVLERIREAFGTIKDTDIYISPGNHDALTLTSPYRRIKWPDNVFVFSGKGQIVERPDKGYRIWGCGFESAFVERRLLAGVTLPRDGLINLGLLHGQLVGKNGRSIYNPITDGDIERSNLDYLALGHVHMQTELLRQGRTFYAYSGTIEGQGFDEEGVKGFFAGEFTREELDRGRAQLEYVSLSKRRYHRLEVDVTGAEGKGQVLERIREALERTDPERYEENLYKILLTGEVAKEELISIGELQAGLEEQLYYVRLKDGTHLAIDYEELAKANSLKGMFAARMLENIGQCRQKGDEALALRYERALELGVRAFYGEVEIDDN